MDRGPRTGIIEGASTSALDLIIAVGLRAWASDAALLMIKIKCVNCCFRGADTYTVGNTNAVLECVLSLLTVPGQV